MCRETPLALYKDFGAILSGIALELAIRFASLECSKAWLVDKETDVVSAGGFNTGE